MNARPKILFILVSILWMLMNSRIAAQTNNIKYLTSTQSALGSNLTSLKGIYGLFGNPGSISASDVKFSLLASSEQRFLLGSLNSTSIGALKKIGSHDYLGLTFGSFGIDEYKEQRFALSYSRKIAATTSLGVTTNYYLQSIEEYGTESDFDLIIGVHTHLSENVALGLTAFNIMSNESEGYLRENTEFGVGIEYALSEKVQCYLEYRSDFSDHAVFSTGIAYQIINRMNLQVGMNTQDNGISLGLSYGFNHKVQINASSRSTQNLGTSPGLSILYSQSE